QVSPRPDTGRGIFWSALDGVGRHCVGVRPDAPGRSPARKCQDPPLEASASRVAYPAKSPVLARAPGRLARFVRSNALRPVAAAALAEAAGSVPDSPFVPLVLVHALVSSACYIFHVISYSAFCQAWQLSGEA